MFDNFKKDENKTVKEEKVMPWIALNDKAQFAKIKEASKTKPQVIFKHSTRCGISSMVLRQFESSYSFEDQVGLYYIDLLNFRDVSQEAASQFQVMHQSPQMLIVKNGVVVHHASHHDIFAQSIGQHI